MTDTPNRGDDCDESGDDDLDGRDDLDTDHDAPGSLFTERCCLGSDCLNPHPYHFSYECFDLEMAEAAEQQGTP